MSLRTTVPEDIYRFEWPSHPTISPDGQQVIYEKSFARKKENDYETQLYIAEIHSNSEKQLTTAGTKNLTPVWSPDGKTIAFISNRLYGAQIWLLPLSGGEARQLTSFKHGINSIAWGSDGKTIYGLTMTTGDEVEVFPKNLSSEEALRTIQQEEKEWVDGGKHYGELYYKNDGSGLQYPRTQQIVEINVSSAAVRLLTKGTMSVIQFTLSSNGKTVAFIGMHENESPLSGGRIYTIPSSGGEVVELYSEINASSPSYSPDGKWLSFFAIHDNQSQLFVMPSEGGKPFCISESYPETLSDMIFTDMRYLRSPQIPQWTNDSRHVFALATHNGRNEIVKFSLDESEESGIVVVGGDRAIFHFSYDGEQTMAIAYSTFNHPGKIAAVKISNAKASEVRLDNCNIQLLSELTVVEPEVFTFHSVDEWSIQGFVLKPANFELGKKYPVLLDIHGGPHSSYGFSYFHQMQLFAAAGFAVVFTNPHGTSGFGKGFTNAVCGDYGGKDMQDILNGLDAALEQYDFLDKNRVAVNGISYGGFMVNWLITHTHRFVAAVSEGSISNWISFDGTSDISPAFIEQEFLGKRDIETLWKSSPLAYVDQVQTPLLLLHNEEDLRCPIEQAEQFYSHIKRRGGKVEFIRIPHSSHALLQYGKPSLRIERLQSMLRFVTANLPVPEGVGND